MARLGERRTRGDEIAEGDAGITDHTISAGSDLVQPLLASDLGVRCPGGEGCHVSEDQIAGPEAAIVTLFLLPFDDREGG